MSEGYMECRAYAMCFKSKLFGSDVMPSFMITDSSYSLVVVATGKQHLATIAGVAEAVVNVSVSVYFVQRIGAVGVAVGTLVGAFISIGLHLALSMNLTRSIILMSRRRFVLEGILRPLLCVTPSILLFPFWRRYAMLPVSPPWIAVWILTTLAFAWLIGLTQAERRSAKGVVSRLI